SLSGITATPVAEGSLPAPDVEDNDFAVIWVDGEQNGQWFFDQHPVAVQRTTFRLGRLAQDAVDGICSLLNRLSIRTTVPDGGELILCRRFPKDRAPHQLFSTDRRCSSASAVVWHGCASSLRRLISAGSQ